MAQARAHALAQARAQAEAQSEATLQARAQEEEQARENAQDPSIKPGDTPPDSGRVGTNPTAGMPMPIPGPDTNCTPSRGSILRAAVSHLRVGGTSAGYLLQLIH